MGVVAGADLALVADGVVDVGEERLLGRRGLGRGPVAVVHQELAGVRQVAFPDSLEVRLARPHHVVAGFAEFFGEEAPAG